MSDLLRGFVIGVTADRRSEEQIALLTGRGAECIHGPTIRTHPIADEAIIAEATKAVIADPPDALVIMTALGIRGWFESADAAGSGDELRHALADVRVFSRGPKAMGGAIAVGLNVEWAARTPTSEAVLEHLDAVLPNSSRIAVVNDGSAEPWLANRLAEAGHDAVNVAVYRWTLPDDSGPAEVLIRAIVDLRTDAVTFTTRPAVDYLVEIATGMGLKDAMLEAFQGPVLPVCVGPVCSAQALKLGLGEPVQPARHRLGAMVQQLTDVLASGVVPFRLAGHDLRLHGRMVTDNSDTREPILLASREKEVLAALLERPGSVVSKTALLDSVWKSRQPGTHVVEVTVGRLRRRLGDLGCGVETVMRRGYRVSPD